MKKKYRPRLPERIEKGLSGGKMTRIKRAYFRFVWPYICGFLFNASGRYKKIQQLADLRPGQRVVEISSGAIPFYLRFREPVGRKGMVVASDYHLEVLQDAVRKERRISKAEEQKGIVKKGAKHVVFDSRKLPFKDGSVDRLIASYVYELDMNEIVRVLKKGGKVIMLDPWALSIRHTLDVDRFLETNPSR